ncbi:MAG: hypothetical protein WBO47_06695, partial [Gammaproteobacteria bacterium]
DEYHQTPRLAIGDVNQSLEHMRIRNNDERGTAAAFSFCIILSAAGRRDKPAIHWGDHSLTDMIAFEVGIE